MRRLLNSKELAEILNYHREVILRKARAGEIPGIKIEKEWRFDQDEIEEWLKEKAKRTKENVNK